MNGISKLGDHLEDTAGTIRGFWSSLGKTFSFLIPFFKNPKGKPGWGNICDLVFDWPMPIRSRSNTHTIRCLVVSRFDITAAWVLDLVFSVS